MDITIKNVGLQMIIIILLTIVIVAMLFFKSESKKNPPKKEVVYIERDPTWYFYSRPVWSPPFKYRRRRPFYIRRPRRRFR